MKLIAGLCVVASSHASACVASENFDIHFPKNSSYVSNSEIVRTANWTADQKIAYARHVNKETTLISGHAEERDRKSVV